MIFGALGNISESRPLLSGNATASAHLPRCLLYRMFITEIISYIYICRLNTLVYLVMWEIVEILINICLGIYKEINCYEMRVAFANCFSTFSPKCRNIFYFLYKRTTQSTSLISDWVALTKICFYVKLTHYISSDK